MILAALLSSSAMMLGQQESNHFVNTTQKQYHVHLMPTLKKNLHSENIHPISTVL